MTVLVAADLDRTLIYSRRAMRLGPAMAAPVCVEVHEGRAVSFVTAAAVPVLATLAARSVLVPVSTRTAAQLARVSLPGPVPRWGVGANGGLLLEGGAPDPAWTRRVGARLRDAVPFARVWHRVLRRCAPEWTVALRDVDGLFCCAIVQPGRVPAGFAEQEAEWAAGRGWLTSVQGRRIYWVPAALRKGDAVAEIARRAGTERIVAAGDSLLDAELLLAADAAIHPSHGELFERGWTAAGVARTRGRGLAAGEEIARWLLAQVSASQLADTPDVPLREFGVVGRVEPDPHLGGRPGDGPLDDRGRPGRQDAGRDLGSG